MESLIPVVTSAPLSSDRTNPTVRGWSISRNNGLIAIRGVPDLDRFRIKGELTEHRAGMDGPVVRKAGDVAFEQTGVTHWWKNGSGKPARALVVDIVPAKWPPRKRDRRYGLTACVAGGSSGIAHPSGGGRRVCRTWPAAACPKSSCCAENTSRTTTSSSPTRTPGGGSCRSM